jgi:hypothetical protein
MSVANLVPRNFSDFAHSHECWNHSIFPALRSRSLSVEQAALLLRNYDAHASVLRRLLLKAATLMPEAAVGFVLENVRNEYGNGDYSNNHQNQLQDVVWQLGVTPSYYSSLPILPPIKRFIREATSFYFPPCGSLPAGLNRAGVVAGAITATEVLAIEEFRSLQIAFKQFGLEHHIWFHHVMIEEEHSDDSVALAEHFVQNYNAREAVDYGMTGILVANVHLYDGLLLAIS